MNEIFMQIIGVGAIYIIGIIYVIWQFIQIGVWLHITRINHKIIMSLKEFKDEGKKNKWLK